MDPINRSQKAEQAPRVETPEAGFESAEAMPMEQPEAIRREEAAAPAPVAPDFPVPAPASQISKDPVFKKVEEIMEEDLKDTYWSMPPDLRAKFKQKGETVAESVRQMIIGAKIKASKVLKLIVAWLKMIPHVNRFFLEQEAKLKTDRIMNFAESEKSKRV
jgi:hypothetical protein